MSSYKGVCCETNAVCGNDGDLLYPQPYFINTSSGLVKCPTLTYPGPASFTITTSAQCHKCASDAASCDSVTGQTTSWLVAEQESRSYSKQCWLLFPKKVLGDQVGFTNHSPINALLVMKNTLSTGKMIQTGNLPVTIITEAVIHKQESKTSAIEAVVLMQESEIRVFAWKNFFLLLSFSFF